MEALLSFNQRLIFFFLCYSNKCLLNILLSNLSPGFVAPLYTQWAQEVKRGWLGRISKRKVVRVKYAGNSMLVEFSMDINNSG